MAAAAIAVLTCIVSIFVIGTELARLGKGRRGALADLTAFALNLRAAMLNGFKNAGVPQAKAEVLAALYAWEFATAFNECGLQLVLRKKKSPFLSEQEHLDWWADRAFFTVREFVYTPEPGLSLGNSGPDPFAGLTPEQATYLGFTNPAAIAYQFQKTQAVEAQLFKAWGGYARNAFAAAGADWTPAMRAAAYAQGQFSWVINGWLNNHTAFNFASNPTGIGGEFQDTPVGWSPRMAANHYVDLRVVEGNLNEASLYDPLSQLSLDFAASDAAKGPVITAPQPPKAQKGLVSR